MTAFVRRYPSEPTEAELLKIEGVVVIDGRPVAQVRGIGTGTILVVGESEDGPFAAEVGAVETFGDADYRTRFGGFGFTYAGVASQYPCARSRKADGATTPEYWNGSIFVHTKSCSFSRSFFARADTSVGVVELTRLASISGNSSPSWDLEPGQMLKLKVDGAGSVTVTWDAAAATILSADGVYPSTFVGGETLTFKIDGTQHVATFTAGDQTHTQVVARLNAAAGSTRFAESTLKTSITGIIRGTAGSVQIVAVSGALVTTATGFTPAAAVIGTGDVANIDLVTDAEVTSRVEADAPGASVDRDFSGRLRVFSEEADGTGTIEVDSTGTVDAFGFEEDVEHAQTDGVDGSIPAGTRVQASGSGQIFVTMQTTAVTAASFGPYSLKVRHAEDDQTGLAEIAGDVDTLFAPLQAGAFAVTNPLPISAALTDAQIDAAYEAAIDKTRGISNPVRQVNVILSARQSNAVRAALVENAQLASANGCFGRIALVRPPFGTSREAARGSAQPGVGAYRTDFAVYCFPGIQKRISEIGAVGTAGGVGFTADGIVNAGADFGVACLISALPPEESIGQLTDGIVDWILGLEFGNADVADLSLDDYVAFKAAGIAAFRVDGDVELQSAITTVDPGQFPALAPINRRRFASFYQDSVARFCSQFVKKLQTKERRALLMSRLNSFKATLNIDQVGSAIFGDQKIAGNTPESLARNVFRTRHFIRMLPTFDVIVLDTLVGNDVTITESGA